MKSLFLVLLFLQVVAFAASQPTPVNIPIQRSPIDKLAIRLRHQYIQISRDLKAGKLTQTQANTLKVQVEAIRKAEIADLKLNGTKTLTHDQLNQLNVQLNNLSKSIPIK